MTFFPGNIFPGNKQTNISTKQTNISTIWNSGKCNKEKKYLKFTLCGEAISISERTKKTPSGGKVMTLLRVLLSTSMTCKTSPARVPNKPAFSTMNSCSFSVVHSNRHVAESVPPVVTVSRPWNAKSSMASMIEARFEGFFCVLRPRSWSEMSVRRLRLADWDWAVRDEQVILVAKLWWWCLV